MRRKRSRLCGKRSVQKHCMRFIELGARLFCNCRSVLQIVRDRDRRENQEQRTRQQNGIAQQHTAILAAGGAPVMPRRARRDQQPQRIECQFQAIRNPRISVGRAASEDPASPIVARDVSNETALSKGTKGPIGALSASSRVGLII